MSEGLICSVTPPARVRKTVHFPRGPSQLVGLISYVYGPNRLMQWYSPNASDGSSRMDCGFDVSSGLGGNGNFTCGSFSLLVLGFCPGLMSTAACESNAVEASMLRSSSTSGRYSG